MGLFILHLAVSVVGGGHVGQVIVKLDAVQGRLHTTEDCVAVVASADYEAVGRVRGDGVSVPRHHHVARQGPLMFLGAVPAWTVDLNRRTPLLAGTYL